MSFPFLPSVRSSWVGIAYTIFSLPVESYFITSRLGESCFVVSYLNDTSASSTDVMHIADTDLFITLHINVFSNVNVSPTCIVVFCLITPNVFIVRTGIVSGNDNDGMSTLKCLQWFSTFDSWPKESCDLTWVISEPNSLWTTWSTYFRLLVILHIFDSRSVFLFKSELMSTFEISSISVFKAVKLFFTALQHSSSCLSKDWCIFILFFSTSFCKLTILLYRLLWQLISKSSLWQYASNHEVEFLKWSCTSSHLCPSWIVCLQSRQIVLSHWVQ